MTEHTSSYEIPAVAEAATLWSFQESALRQTLEVEFEMALIERQSQDASFSPQERGDALHEKIVPTVFFEILKLNEAQELLLEPSRPLPPEIQKEIRLSVRQSLNAVLAA